MFNYILLFIEVQFTYDDPSPLSPSHKASPSPKTFRSPRGKRLDSDKDDTAWIDDETASPIEPYCANHHHHHQQHSELHRASIASAPATSLRSGSISIGVN